MSGNPFRRKPQPQPAPDWYSGDATSISRIATPPDAERRPSKVKRVRIQTPPPLSPDSVHEDDDWTISRVGEETHEGSPPPDPSRIDPSAIAPSTDPPDVYERSETEDDSAAEEELLQNTRRNSASGSAASVDVPIIRNPFHKTLATMESTQQPATLDTGQEPSAATDSGKPALDVDSFKRLLMTGTKHAGGAEASPAPSSTTNTTTSSYFTGDSSSTDTSSVSRHSLSEHPTGSSDTGYETPSDEERELTPVSQHSFKKPDRPPPPKHRHGRSIDTPRVPETVPFSSFSPTTEVPPAVRSASKPVPPPPPQRKGRPSEAAGTTSEAPPSSEQSTIFPQNSRSYPSAAASVQVVPSHTPQHTETRQGRPSDIPETSSAATTRYESPSSYSSEPRTSKPSKPPPPPPTRRSGTQRASQAEHFPIPAKASPMSPMSETAPTPASNTPSRSSSISSYNRPAIPPPPPPRRRGSSKSSLDHASVAEAVGVSPRASVDASKALARPSSIAEEGRTMRSGSGETVLADMDALQAEIDALKARYGQRS